jgi:hypothetical protein
MVLQPGSTISTSINETEAKMKQCVLLDIKEGSSFESRSILLEKSFRPMFI